MAHNTMEMPTSLAYEEAMNKMVGSTISVKWEEKGRGEVPTTTILVPIVYGGHRLTLHFITPI